MQHTVPSIKVSAVDTTGAGDAFIGCLLFQIAQLHNIPSIFEDTDSLLEMVKVANRAGALTTTQFGAINALPTLNQLQS